MRKLLSLLILSLSLSANMVVAAGQDPKDWPQWRGSNRDGVSLEKNLLKEWPENGPPLLWDSNVVNPGKDDRLGISWSTKLGIGGRPNSTPTIDGKKLVFTPGGDEAAMVALNKYNGKVIWKSAIPGYGGCGHASIVVAEVGGIRQYVTLAGSKNFGMVGVNAANGKFLWNYKGVAPVEGHGCIPTPIVQGDLVFCSGAYQGGASLVRLVPDGEGGIKANEVFHLKGNEVQVMHGGMVLVEATPKGYHLRSMFQIGTGNPTFRERNSSTNRELPGDLDTGWPHPVVANGRLYIRAKNKVLCYDIRQS